MIMNISGKRKNFYPRISFQIFFTFFVALSLFSSSSLFAASSNINISAELSRNRVAAGDMVQLDVQVTGAQQADLPREIAVDGLQIRLAGQSSQVQMVNYSVTSSVIYSYIVIPLRSGTFTIPSLQVRAEGKYFRTSPLQLTVVGNNSSNNTSPSSAPGPSISFAAPATQRSSTPPSDSKIAFGELSISKKKLYVGEVVPAELRFYVDAHYSATPRHNVDFSNEGVIVERLSEPETTRVERNGTIYNVATFHTLISAVKPGPLEIGPATLDVAIEIPESAPAGMPDVLSQLLGHAGMSQQRPLTLKSNRVSLEVIPLPKEGRPDSFSGAVGEFQIDAMALPKKYVVGDPVTLALTIEGNGNIRAVSMPQLTDTNGWRTYPPTDRIDAPDVFGMHGIKTFETTMIAQQPCTTTPSSIFSYFNPNSGKYVTLTTKPVPITPIPQAAPSNQHSEALPAITPNLSTTPIKKEAQPLSHFSSSSWQTPFYRIEFVIASISLFFALLLFALYLGIRYYQKSERLLEQQQLKKLLLELSDPKIEPANFFNKAAFCAEMLIAKYPTERINLEEIFQRRDEIHYGARETILRNSERQQILEKLTSLINLK